jgi:hypothetical protein
MLSGRAERRKKISNMLIIHALGSWNLTWDLLINCLNGIHPNMPRSHFFLFLGSPYSKRRKTEKKKAKGIPNI